MYEVRAYRDFSRPADLVPFTVVVKETDLFILARTDLRELALETVINHRHKLESFIGKYPEFRTSLTPVKIPGGAPEVVRIMASAGEAAGVGPMAAVAGTFSELVGNALMERSAEVIVENGGDIFINTVKERSVALFAGDSPLSGKVGIKVSPGDCPLGVCTSSGKVGPSLSLGLAHAACILAKSAALADAAATAAGNAVKAEGDVKAGLDVAARIEGVLGAVIISGDKLGAWGKVELVEISISGRGE
jgi:uncharacterized protein